MKLKAGKNPPEEINVFVEIPQGSNVKYELDKESGLVFVDNRIIQDGLTLLLMVWQLVYLIYFMMLTTIHNMLRMLEYILWIRNRS